MKKMLIGFMLLSLTQSSAIGQSAKNDTAWHPNPKYTAIGKSAGKEKTEYVQCFGTKPNGERCKIKVKKDGAKNVYCRFHSDQKNSE